MLATCAGMLSHFSHVWFFATLWTIAYQAPLSMGFSRQENWVAMPSSRESSQSSNRSWASCTEGRFFTIWAMPDSGLCPRIIYIYLIFIFTLFYFIILYWFCHTLTWIRHGCTWVPNHESPSHHLSGSSLCTSPRHPASRIEHRLAIRFLHDSIHVSAFSLLLAKNLVVFCKAYSLCCMKR